CSTDFSCSSSFFLSIYLYILNLHSFPTRRSSDLKIFVLFLALTRDFSCLTRVIRNRICKIASDMMIRMMKPFIFYFPFSKINQRSEEHTSELQSLRHLVCRLLLEKKKKKYYNYIF